MLFHEEITKTDYVCPRCEHHFRLPSLRRLEMIFDNQEYTLVQLPKVKEDPLHFSDLKKYTDRLKEARKKTKADDAILVAHGKIGGKNAVVGVFNFNFMGGSMGTYVGEAIITAANLAMVQEAALILIPASGGARMQEGMLSLMQMARTSAAVNQVKEKGLPFISVLTDLIAGAFIGGMSCISALALSMRVSVSYLTRYVVFVFSFSHIAKNMGSASNPFLYLTDTLSRLGLMRPLKSTPQSSFNSFCRVFAKSL